MNRAVYYPGFEATVEPWLKATLLYLDELHPIIPFSAKDKLTPLHKLISENTDFLKIHRPDVPHLSVPVPELV